MRFGLIIKVSVITAIAVGCSSHGKPADDGPAIQADALVAPEGSELTFSVDAADVTWDFGDGQQGSGSPVHHLFADDGMYHVVASASGWTGAADVEIDNVAPTANLGEPIEWVPDRPLTLPITLADPGIFDAITVAIDWGDGASDAPAGQGRRLAIQHVYAEGTFTATVTAKDDGGASSASTLSIHVWPHPIVEIHADVPTWTAVGTPWSGAIEANDLDGASVPVTLAQAPAGMTLDTSGIVRWQPQAGDAGAHDVVVTAGPATRTLHLTVSAVDVAASAWIDAAAGGVVEVDDPASPLFGVRVELPAGALAASTTISIGRLATPPPDGEDAPIGEAIELMPSGTLFAQDVTVRIPSSRSDAAIATYTDTLHVGQAWQELAHRDATNGVISGTVRHFSPFELVSTPLWQMYSNGRVAIYYVPSGTDMPSMKKYVATGQPYLSGVPPYVQDLARTLDLSYTYYASLGYEPGRQSGPISVRIKDTSKNVADAWTNDDGAEFDIVVTNAYADTTLVRGTAAHELFHKCQYHAFGPAADDQKRGLRSSFDRIAVWLWEASATDMALEVVGGSWGGGNANATWLLTTDLRGTGFRGYEAFPLFKLTRTHMAWDLTKELFAVRGDGGSSRTPAITTLEEYGKTFVYRRVREMVALAGVSEYRFWGELAFAFEYGHTEAWLRGVRTWLSSAPQNGLAIATTGLERAVPAAGEQPPVTPIPLGVTAAQNIGPGGIETFAIAPLCTTGATAMCAARKLITPAAQWELVVDVATGASVKGIVQIAHVDPANPLADVAPVYVGELAGGKLLAIPLTKLAGDYDQIVVSFFNAGTAADKVPLRTYFRKAGGRHLVAGLETACWLRDDTSVWCWGFNGYGELSRGTIEPLPGSPAHSTPAPAMLDASTPLSGVKHIWANGGASTFCVTIPVPGSTQDALFCWGQAQNDELGTGTTVAGYAYPQFITAGEIREVAPYHGITCLIVEDGRVDCWGQNYKYQLGNGLADNAWSDRAPVMDSGAPMQNAVAVSGSYNGATCAVLSDGTTKCWGSNYSAGIGLPSGVSVLPSPGAVPGITNAVGLSAAASTCVLLGDGGVRCWGANPYGDTGNGSTLSDPQFTPFDPGLSNIIQISITWGAGCALDRAGSVWCWGNNDTYQVGVPRDPMADVGLRPVQVTGLGAATEIAVGGDFACALVDNLPWCWGWNRYGELGDGQPVPGFPYNSRYQPMPIAMP